VGHLDPLEDRPHRPRVRPVADILEVLRLVGEGPFDVPVWPVWQGIEITRSFRGLAPWMAFVAYGGDAIVAAIENDLRLARLLAEAVRAAPDLELLDEPQLSIVVYRHHPAGLDDPAALDAHNRSLLDAMQRDGRVLLSGTTIRGTFALRPCMTHHRSTDADVLALAEVASELGAVLAPRMLSR